MITNLIASVTMCLATNVTEAMPQRMVADSPNNL